MTGRELSCTGVERGRVREDDERGRASCQYDVIENKYCLLTSSDIFSRVICRAWNK